MIACMYICTCIIIIEMAKKNSFESQHYLFYSTMVVSHNGPPSPLITLPPPSPPPQVFHRVMSDASSTEYWLCGMVAYYGHHYCTFCYHTVLRQWGFFDDANFRTVCPQYIYVNLYLQAYTTSPMQYLCTCVKHMYIRNVQLLWPPF